MVLQRRFGLFLGQCKLVFHIYGELLICTVFEENVQLKNSSDTEYPYRPNFCETAYRYRSDTGETEYLTVRIQGRQSNKASAKYSFVVSTG